MYLLVYFLYASYVTYMELISRYFALFRNANSLIFVLLACHVVYVTQPFG